MRAVRADLRSPDGVDHLVAALTGLAPDVAALNAGVGQGGAFVGTDPDDDRSVIDLDVTSTVRLAEPLLRDMAARGVGRLMFTSSVAATMPGSFQSVHNASKSFVHSLAQALQEEVEGTGVTVTSFMPGPTETDFFRRAGMTDTKVGTMPKDDPAQVARQAYDAVMKGRGKLITGSAKTKAQAVADKALPDRVKAAVHRRMAEPGTARDDGGRWPTACGSAPAGTRPARFARRGACRRLAPGGTMPSAPAHRTGGIPRERRTATATGRSRVRRAGRRVREGVRRVPDAPAFAGVAARQAGAGQPGA